jgi:polyhydroxyalkanoate synthase subunit PhaC
MAKKAKNDVIKHTVTKHAANLKTDSKIAEDVARGTMAEPQKLMEAAQTMLNNASPFYWFSLQQRFAQQHVGLVTRLFGPAATDPGTATAGKPDPRFAAPEWEEQPWFRWLKDAYLTNAKLTAEAIERANLDPAQRQQLEFYTRLMSEAWSPANFAMTNPEAIKTAIETRGASVMAGMRQLGEDMGKGYISLTDESAFEIGRNIAATPGEVIFENRVMQLIHYAPSGDTVHSRPMLFVPPFVNKFYLMDLEPENSFVRWTVEQGHQLFLVSFKNTTEAERDLTWDQYVTDGVIKAMEIVREVTEQKNMNVLAFCTGGTLMATAFAPLIAQGRKSWVSSLTLIAAGLEFTDIGELGVYMDSPFMRYRSQSLKSGGVMPARDIAAAFASLKANDLVWGNVANNYLKGKKHTPFGLLYWNSDPTNLPGPMYAWYLEHTYMGNKLIRPGGATVCGTPFDIRSISLPTYAMGAIEDHIVPWRGAYESARHLGSDVRFCLGGGGHIAGTMNPASKNRRNYWVADQKALPEDADQWLGDATSLKGSWWNDWAKWLEPHLGKRVAAPKRLGSRTHAPIEPAPGRYVEERSV